MPRALPAIKDKMDVDSAAEIVAIGYPDNKDALEELIFWSCFPNDLVCWVTFPYISSLRDEMLAPAMAKFIEFHHNHGQTDLISDVFWLFINERGEAFREQILSAMHDEDAKSYFSSPDYSLEQHAENRGKFDALQKDSASGWADAEEGVALSGSRSLGNIKSEDDIEGAKHLVSAGYPENETALDALIFWACYPDKPICAVAFPYISSLQDELLAPAMATFIESRVEQGQPELMADAFRLFIKGRGESFRRLIVSYMRSGKARTLFSSAEYSVD